MTTVNRAGSVQPQRLLAGGCRVDLGQRFLADILMTAPEPALLGRSAGVALWGEIAVSPPGVAAVG